MSGTGAAASGHQLGAVWNTFVGASVAGLYQLLQDVVGLGVMTEALQHPQDVTVRVSQLEKSLHFGVLLLVVHRGCWFRMRVCPLLCLLRTVWLGNPLRLLILVHQRLHGDGLCFRADDRGEKGRGQIHLCHCKHRKNSHGLTGVFGPTDGFGFL